MFFCNLIHFTLPPKMQIEKTDKIRTTILTEKYKETVRLDLKVIYGSGATGTGKTSRALEKNGYSNVYRITDYVHPFDGYAYTAGLTVYLPLSVLLIF